MCPIIKNMAVPNEPKQSSLVADARQREIEQLVKRLDELNRLQQKSKQLIPTLRGEELQAEVNRTNAHTREITYIVNQLNHLRGITLNTVHSRSVTPPPKIKTESSTQDIKVVSFHDAPQVRSFH